MSFVPLEIWQKVLSFLPRSHLVRIRRLNWTFHHLAQHDSRVLNIHPSEVRLQLAARTDVVYLPTYYGFESSWDANGKDLTVRLSPDMSNAISVFEEPFSEIEWLETDVNYETAAHWVTHSDDFQRIWWSSISSWLRECSNTSASDLADVHHIYDEIAYQVRVQMAYPTKFREARFSSMMTCCEEDSFFTLLDLKGRELARMAQPSPHLDEQLPFVESLQVLRGSLTGRAAWIAGMDVIGECVGLELIMPWWTAIRLTL